MTNTAHIIDWKTVTGIGHMGWFISADKTSRSAVVHGKRGDWEAIVIPAECVDVAMARERLESVREHFVEVIARAVEERPVKGDYTVDDVARAAGISRARVYQLLKERDDRV